MHERPVELGKAVNLGLQVGVVVSGVLGIVRIAIGSGVGPDFELDYQSFVELAISPWTMALSLPVGVPAWPGQVVAFVVTLAIGASIYGTLALLTAAAWRFTRGAGILVLCVFGCWSAMWLVGGVGWAEVVPK